MPDVSVLMLALNAVLFILLVVLSGIIIHDGSKFTYNIGDDQVQNRYKWRILRALVAIIMIGLIASGLNVFFA